uniref:Cell wall protein-like n=1 Tax=Oryza sativa subsp. japonica TaxID=39947 RepID=Q6ZF15_ORYSJ|nr:cell wall protein-like [Oryza sativa Japonica Group]BAD31639.1 cell wall protein-like [Oryza sativa Japonica Group]
MSRRSPGSSSHGAASVIVIAAACPTPSSPPCSCCRLPSSPPRRPRSSSSSSSRCSRSSWRSSLRQADRVRRPRFVKCAAAPSSSSSSAPRRQASCWPRLAFVQGSPLKSSPRRSSPSFPAVSAAPVRRCRSHASSRGGKDSSPSLPRPRPFGVARARCAVVGPGTRVSVSAVVRLCVW